MAGDVTESDSGSPLRSAFGDPADGFGAETAPGGYAAAIESVWNPANLASYRAASQAQMQVTLRTVVDLFDVHRPVSIDCQDKQLAGPRGDEQEAEKLSTIVRRLGDEQFSVRRQASSDLASIIAESPAEILKVLGSILKDRQIDPEAKKRIEVALSPYVSEFERVAADVPDACQRLGQVFVRPDKPWLVDYDPSRSNELRAVHDFVELFSSSESKQKLLELKTLADGLGLNRISYRLDKLDDLAKRNRGAIDDITEIVLPTATDDDLSFLGAFRNLGSIDLQQSGITDAGLRHLSGLDKVTRLCLTSTNITGAGLKYLAGMKNLDRLSLDNTEVSDAGLLHIAKLESLQFLDLGNTAISDRGLASIGQLKGVFYLFLDHTKVTDAGLRHLEKAPVLGQLELYGTKVTQEAKDRLIEKLPGLAIDYNKRDAMWWSDELPLY